MPLIGRRWLFLVFLTMALVDATGLAASLTDGSHWTLVVSMALAVALDGRVLAYLWKWGRGSAHGHAASRS